MRGLFSMRAAWLVGWAIAWNALFVTAAWLNDWERQIHDPRAAVVATVALLGTAALFGSILGSERIRERVIAPSRRAAYEPKPFWTFAVISAVLAIVILIETPR